jgi:hypothetical protein
MREITERGLQLFSEFAAQNEPESMLQLIEDNSFGFALANVAVDSVFASTWTREGSQLMENKVAKFSDLSAA